MNIMLRWTKKCMISVIIMAFVLAIVSASANVCAVEIQNDAYQINSVDELEDEVLNNNENFSEEELVKETAPAVLEEYLDETTSEFDELSDKLNSIDSSKGANELEKENGILSVDYSESHNTQSDITVTNIKAETERGTVEITLTDAPDVESIKDALTGAVVNKGYGNRYFTGSKKIWYKGFPYPKIAVMAHLHYTVNKNKTMKYRFACAKDVCEGDKAVDGKYTVKIIKARVDSGSTSYGWAVASCNYSIRFYKKENNKNKVLFTRGATSSITAHSKKYYKNSVDIDQSFGAGFDL